MGKFQLSDLNARSYWHFHCEKNQNIVFMLLLNGILFLLLLSEEFERQLLHCVHWSSPYLHLSPEYLETVNKSVEFFRFELNWDLSN